MLVSGLILGLYFWVFFSGATSVTAVLLVPDYAAIAAGAAFLMAVIAHFWSPRTQLFSTAIISYALLLAMTGILIINTGNLSSPFIALWMLGAVFSPVFGWYGIGLVLLAAVAYGGWQWSIGEIDAANGFMLALLSVVPIVVGVLGLRSGANPKTTEDRSYHELASELSAVANKSDAVISAIADGVIAVDRQGIIQLINPAAQKLLGWGHKDAVGLDYKSVLKIIDTRDQIVSDMNDPIAQAMTNNQQAHIDTYSLATADAGKKFLASINASPLGSMGSGVIVVFRDITNEKAEEREQAEFISTASHEMRTPVASIEGYLGLALNPSTATVDEKARDYIGKAQESAQHLGRLFQDLLDVSKADDGRLKNDPRVVDVVPFMRDIVRGLLPKATDKGLHVTYKPMPDLDPAVDEDTERGDRILAQVLYVNVDNDHLREVLANLVENAIKYTLAGSITIDVVGSDENVTISVTDSGIGIPKEDIGHLFQKFYRVDNTATREIGGTGLGLYLCRKLTETMGGTIWVESVYQQGSTFYVRLPRVDHVEAKRLIERSHQEHATVNSPLATPVAPLPIPTVAPTPAPVVESTPPIVAAPPMSTIATPTETPPSMPTQTPMPVAPDDVARPSLDALAPTSPNAAPVYRPNARNTSLSDIERNPGQYIRPGGASIPDRTPPRYDR